MQNIILAYFYAMDAAELLYGQGGVSEDLLHSLESFDSQASVILKEFALTAPGSRWALDVVPAWAASGIAAGIMPTANVDSSATLQMFAGMEARRHLSPEEVEEALVKVCGPNRNQELTSDQVFKLTKMLDRSPNSIRPHSTWKQAFWVLTKRRHSEFLRTVTIRLGAWIADGGTPYEKVYRDALKEQGAKDYSLVQVQTRARNAAVGRFLSDYFHAMGRVSAKAI